MWQSYCSSSICAQSRGQCRKTERADGWIVRLSPVKAVRMPIGQGSEGSPTGVNGCLAPLHDFHGMAFAVTFESGYDASHSSADNEDTDSGFWVPADVRCFGDMAMAPACAQICAAVRVTIDGVSVHLSRILQLVLG